MSNIIKAQKNLKKKLSLDDYVQSEVQERSSCEISLMQDELPSQTIKHEYEVEKKADQVVASSKIKATYYLTEDDHSALTHVYIKRLQNKQKTDRSALISEAIRLLYKKELA